MMVTSRVKNPKHESIAVLAYMVLVFNTGERPLFNAKEVREMAQEELSNPENCYYTRYAIVCGLVHTLTESADSDMENVRHAVQYAYNVLGL